MKEIREGLEEGLDVSVPADPNLTAKEMEEMREEMEEIGRELEQKKNKIKRPGM